MCPLCRGDDRRNAILSPASEESAIVFTQASRQQGVETWGTRKTADSRTKVEMDDFCTRLISATRALVASCGHEMTCGFRACTCGKVERQKEALLTVNRTLRERETTRQ